MIKIKSRLFPLKVFYKVLVPFFLFSNISAQTIDQYNSPAGYDVQPGTKVNIIKLTIINGSEINKLENIQIKLMKYPEDVIKFKSSSQLIHNIESKEEAEITFEFDVNRSAQVNKKDTIRFEITEGRNIYAYKDIILNITHPKEFKLEQNYPNPFNPTTTIQYQLPIDSKVTMKIYDILGEEVTTLINDVQKAGFKEVVFNASNLASGIYLCRLSTDKYVSVKKMMLIK